MRLHLLGIPHTVTNNEYTACAYTAKVLKFGKMFTGQDGVEVFHYGHEDSDVCCDEHITVTTNDDLKKAYGNALTLPPRKHNPIITNICIVTLG